MKNGMKKSFSVGVFKMIYGIMWNGIEYDPAYLCETVLKTVFVVWIYIENGLSYGSHELIWVTW